MKAKENKIKISNQLIFYVSMMTVPILMFIVLNIIINVEYVLLAFKEYNPLDNTYSFVWFKNFGRVLKEFALEESVLRTSFFNSVVLWAWRTFLGMPLAILFSFYIARKKTFSGFYYTVLFLPTIISTMVMIFLYSYFMDSVVPTVTQAMFAREISPPLGNVNSQWSMVILYNIVFSFGTYVLFFIGSITGISEEIIESAQLDGATPFTELIYIVIPLIFPTISTFIVVRIANMFADTAGLYSFFMQGAQHQTIGYYLYKDIMSNRATRGDYPYYSAIGLLFSAIIIPITLIVRKLLEKVATVE